MANPILLILGLITKGVFTLSGPQEISVVVGDTAVMSCQYHSFYYDYVKYWCKGYYWNHCTVLIKTNEATNIKGKIQLLDDKHHRTFTLTLKNVKMEDGGWYWCAIERVSKHVKVAVMLTVTTGTPYQSPKISKTTPLPLQVKVTTSNAQTTSLFLPSTTEEQKTISKSRTDFTSTVERTTNKPQDLVWNVWSIARWIFFFAMALYLFCFMACHHLRTKRRKSSILLTKLNESCDGMLAPSHQQASVTHSLAESSLYCRYRDMRKSVEENHYES